MLQEYKPPNGRFIHRLVANYIDSPGSHCKERHEAPDGLPTRLSCCNTYSAPSKYKPSQLE